MVSEILKAIIRFKWNVMDFRRVVNDLNVTVSWGVLCWFLWADGPRSIRSADPSNHFAVQIHFAIDQKSGLARKKPIFKQTGKKVDISECCICPTFGSLGPEFSGLRHVPPRTRRRIKPDKRCGPCRCALASNYGSFQPRLGLISRQKADWTILSSKRVVHV